MTFTLPSNTTTTYSEMYVWANNTVGGILGYGMLLVVFAMVYFGTKRFGATQSHAVLVSSTTTTMIGAALTIMGVLNSWVLTWLIVGTALSFIWTYHD